MKRGRAWARESIEKVCIVDIDMRRKSNGCGNEVACQIRAEDETLTRSSRGL
jgi:hypothetical protein